MHASMQDLSSHTKEFLDAAIKGEEVLITYPGHDYIKLVPIKKKEKQENLAFGLWKDNQADDV